MAIHLLLTLMVQQEPWHDRLERIRRAFNWSYAQLGKVFGVSSSTAYNWANGRSPIPPAVQSHIHVLERVVQEKQMSELKEFGERLLSVGIIAFGGWVIKKVFEEENGGAE